MNNRIKIIITISAAVLLASGCGKAQPQSVDKPISPSANQQQATSSNDQVAIPKGQTQTRDNAGKPDYKPGFIIVSQTVEGSNLNEPYTQILDGATARDLLTVAHKVDFKSYGSLGDFVEKIDGIAPDSKHFWEFFVNGKSSNVGASSYVLKTGDKIEWKLSAISLSGQ